MAAAIGRLLIAGLGSLETGSAKYVTWQETDDTDWLAACQSNTVGKRLTAARHKAWVVLALPGRVGYFQTWGGVCTGARACVCVCVWLRVCARVSDTFAVSYRV